MSDNCPKCGSPRTMSRYGREVVFLCGTRTWLGSVAIEPESCKLRQRDARISSLKRQLAERDAEVRGLRDAPIYKVVSVEWSDHNTTFIEVEGLVSPCGRGDEVAYHSSTRAAAEAAKANDKT